MLDYIAVTTCSAPGYALYGRRFVESFLEFWPIPLVFYYEKEPPDIDHPRLLLRDLDQDPDRTRFLHHYDRPGFRGTDDYATQAIRFCHKVFAFTASEPGSRWRLWFDADVETFGSVEPSLLEEICPPGAALSYLGRQGAQHSETGFIACLLEEPCGAQFVNDLRRLYMSGALFDLDPHERNDAALFDRVRSLVPPERQHNLSAASRDTHVWPHTALGRVMHHWKGQARKRAAYGGTVS